MRGRHRRFGLMTAAMALAVAIASAWGLIGGPGGGIVASGATDSGNGSDFALARYRQNEGLANVGWMRASLPARAPRARAVPRPETASRSARRFRGKVLEIASDGRWAAALVDKSKVDCHHVVAWTPGRTTVMRFAFPTRFPAPCDKYDRSLLYGLSVQGTTVKWNDYYCGSYCYIDPYQADVRHPHKLTRLEEESFEDGDGPSTSRPKPPHETHGGIEFSVEQGTIHLRWVADGRIRTIRPPGRLVDAELEDDGLYYAYNLRHGALRGRVLFLPFDQLIPG